MIEVVLVSHTPPTGTPQSSSDAQEAGETPIPPTESLAPGNTPFAPASTSSTTPVPTDSPTQTPTFTPTATATPSATLAPETATSIPSSTTPKPTATQKPSPQPTEPSITPTETPAASVQPLPVPALLAPADGEAFTHRDEIALEWQPLESLPAEVYYVVTLAYSHEGATWFDEVPWTKDTKWVASEHDYLLDYSDDGRFQWSVQVMQKTGTDPEGKPLGEAVSPISPEWSFVWKYSDGGGTFISPLPTLDEQ